MFRQRHFCIMFMGAIYFLLTLLKSSSAQVLPTTPTIGVATDVTPTTSDTATTATITPTTDSSSIPTTTAASSTTDAPVSNVPTTTTSANNGSSLQVKWSEFSACDAGTACSASFEFVATDDILIERLATIEVINSSSSATVDVAAYKTDSISWIWYVPSTLPTGQYRYKYMNTLGNRLGTLTSPEFSVVGVNKLCTPEPFYPRNSSAATIEAVRVTSPLATTADVEAGTQLNFFFTWIDMKHQFGEGVLSLTIDLLAATSRRTLGDIAKTYEDFDPKKGSGNILLPNGLKSGPYIFRFTYTLSEEVKVNRTSFSEVFGIGSPLSCGGSSNKDSGSAKDTNTSDARSIVVSWLSMSVASIAIFAVKEILA